MSKIEKKINKSMNFIDKILKNEEFIDNNRNEIIKLGMESQINLSLYNFKLNESNLISGYVTKKVNYLKNYMIYYDISTNDILLIESSLRLLSRVQSANIKSIKTILNEIRNCNLSILDFTLLSPNAIPIYKSFIDDYVKSLEFNK